MITSFTNMIRLLSLTLCVAGFGLANPAFAQKDERQQFPQVSTMSPHGVDLQQGTFVKQGVDLSIGPLSVDHYIRSRIPVPLNGILPFSPFASSLHGFTNHHESPGAGGSTDVVENIYIGQQRITFHVNGSTGEFFPFDSGNTGWKMVTSGVDWILTNKSGETYVFNTHPGISSWERRLTSRTSADGHKLSYTYDSTARLRTVTSNRGYAVVIDYSGNSVIACGINLAVSAIPSTCSGSAYKVTYGLDSSGRVTTITGLDSSVVTITYALHGPTCISLPNSSACAIQNTYGTNTPSLAFDVHGQVVSQTTATGETWNYSHIGIENNPGDYTPGFGEIRRSFGYMTPPGTGMTSATFGNGFIETLAAPEGTTTYEYSTQGAYAVLMGGGVNAAWTGPHYYSVYPSRITYPEGNSIQFTRDWADNVTLRIENPKPGSGLPQNVTGWIYPASNQWSSPTICAVANVLCDKPTQVIDPNGNATDFTYNATHGGMLTKTEAAVNGIRPQTRYTYVQRYARDVTGTALQPPVWVLASEEYCKTTAASGSGCAGGAADEVVTTYDYGPTTGPNNLLLRGTVVDPTGLNLRTCYTYDQYGRKISETQPLGTGSTCP